jgi:hypothetical protein
MGVERIRIEKAHGYLSCFLILGPRGEVLVLLVVFFFLANVLVEPEEGLAAIRSLLSMYKINCKNPFGRSSLCTIYS